jgi:hypothetical protein
MTHALEFEIENKKAAESPVARKELGDSPPEGGPERNQHGREGQFLSCKPF